MYGLVGVFVFTHVVSASEETSAKFCGVTLDFRGKFFCRSFIRNMLVSSRKTITADGIRVICNVNDQDELLFNVREAKARMVGDQYAIQAKDANVTFKDLQIFGPRVTGNTSDNIVTMNGYHGEYKYKNYEKFKFESKEDLVMKDFIFSSKNIKAYNRLWKIFVKSLKINLSEDAQFFNISASSPSYNVEVKKLDHRKNFMKATDIKIDQRGNFVKAKIATSFDNFRSAELPDGISGIFQKRNFKSKYAKKKGDIILLDHFDIESKDFSGTAKAARFDLKTHDLTVENGKFEW